MADFAAAWFEYFPLPLYIVSLILHGMGTYVLLTLRSRRSNQDTIILNLSVSEIFMSLFDLTQNILSRYVAHKDAPTNYLTIIQCTLFVLPNFLILFILTLDRLLEVYLNIKYKVYVTKSKTRLQLRVCWCTGCACAIVIITLRVTIYKDVARYIFMYIFPIVEGLLFLFAVTTYIYIYRRLLRNQRPPTHYPSVHGNIQTTTRSIKLFPPFLILITFFIFAIAPDVANLFLFYIYDEVGTNLHSNILLTLYVIGFICDALIYIFLQSHIRHWLKRKFFWKHFRAHDIHLAVINSISNPNFSRNVSIATTLSDLT